MRLGAILGPVADGSNADAVAEQARMLAGEGYASIWSAQAIGRGHMIMDPFIALAVAATATQDLELGTGIVQVPLYHPMDLAHRTFSLQQICGDRLLLGIGAGSTAADFVAYERDYDGRFKDFEQSVTALRGIFATGGIGESNLSPWPAVKGGPPLIFGTWGKGVERAATEYDGWIASGLYRTPDELAAARARYVAAGGGRSIVSTIIVSGETDLGELQAKLDRFAEIGFDDAVVMILPGGPSPADVRRLVA